MKYLHLLLVLFVSSCLGQSMYIQCPTSGGVRCVDGNAGYNVLSYGLVGDGVTNNSAAFAAMVASIPSGSVVYFPPNLNFVFSSVVVITKKLYITGSYSKLSTSSNNVIFRFDSGSEKSQVSRLCFFGSSAGAVQSGLYFNGVGGCNVSECYFQDMGGYGVVTTSTYLPVNVGLVVTNSKFYGCNYGVYFGTRAEYSLVTSCDFQYNSTAIFCDSGNLDADGNTIIRNGVGVEISSGTNDGHGIVSNNQINHNTTYNVYAHDYGNGFTFDNNHVFDGEIRVVNTTGTSFYGGIVDVNTLTFTNNTGTVVNGCRVGNSYSNTLSVTGSYPLFLYCYNWDGSIYSTVTTPTIVAGANITISSGGSIPTYTIIGR